MESYDPTQYIHVPNLHTTLTSKHYLDLDEFDESGHVASKRACLQPQYSLTESSLPSAGLQPYNINLDIDPDFDLNIDPNFDSNPNVETAEVTDIFSFEDQMDTGSSTQEDIMSSRSSRAKLSV